VLIDSNADLIGGDETVRAQPDDVAGELDRLAAAHARGGRRDRRALRTQQQRPRRRLTRDPRACAARDQQ
jgi:hypothetical protein